MTKFWINTKGARKFVISLEGSPIESTVPADVRMIFGIKQCTGFECMMFDIFHINLKTRREDRYKWLKFFIKTKWERFIAEIVQGLYKTFQKTR